MGFLEDELERYNELIKNWNFKRPRIDEDDSDKIRPPGYWENPENVIREFRKLEFELNYVPNKKEVQRENPVLYSQGIREQFGNYKLFLGKIGRKTSDINKPIENPRTEEEIKRDLQERRWNFDSENMRSFLETLSKRNECILKQVERINFEPGNITPHKNEVCVDYRKLGDLEKVAFHVGYPGQERLYPLIDFDFKTRCNKGVFFSLYTPEVIHFLGLIFDNIHNQINPKLMVYFLNLDYLKESRIQIDYESPTIYRYDLDDELISRDDFQQLSGEFISGEYDRLTDIWVQKNTIPFDIGELEEYKKKDYTWLIISDPIKVKY
jgi:hypothetical protein